MSLEKKKKKTLIIVSILGGLLLLIGVFFLGRISTEKSSEPKSNLPSDSQEIQKLKKELNLVKSQLNQSNINQKNQLESELSNLESKINVLSSQEKQDKSVIRKLEQQIKEIKNKLEGKDDSPNNPKPNDKKKGKFTYFTLLRNNHIFENISSGQKQINIEISENHPRIKQLLNEGKLQDGKEFIISYGKVDKKIQGDRFVFDENNQELEIREIEN